MNKIRRITYIALSACMLLNTKAYAEPTISDVPYEVSTADVPETVTSETTAVAAGTAATETTTAPPEKKTLTITEAAPQAESKAESSASQNTDSTEAAETKKAASGTANIILSDEPTTEEYNEVGLSYAKEPAVSVDLGFQLVSPAHQYSGLNVAEGSVQLVDGSWDEIGYDKLIRGGYYKLIREATDSTGVQWYIVAVNASRIGNYYTPDGSHATELWLKKNDCTLSSTISLNTSNATRQNIVKTALSLAGSRYVYGGNGPESFDCSGFVKYVMAQNGISVPRTSTEQCYAGTEVGISGLRPGDIVGRSGHVGIYIGNGYFIHSSESSTGVVVESVAVYNKYNKFTNYVNVVGD